MCVCVCVRVFHGFILMCSDVCLLLPVYINVLNITLTHTHIAIVVFG